MITCRSCRTYPCVHAVSARVCLSVSFPPKGADVYKSKWTHFQKHADARDHEAEQEIDAVLERVNHVLVFFLPWLQERPTQALVSGCA
jgi:hypothetical protein